MMKRIRIFVSWLMTLAVLGSPVTSANALALAIPTNDTCHHVMQQHTDTQATRLTHFACCDHCDCHQCSNCESGNTQHQQAIIDDEALKPAATPGQLISLPNSLYHSREIDTDSTPPIQH